MRSSIKSAIGETAQDMVDAGVRVSFTKKDLDSLGVIIPEVKMGKSQIQSIRKQMSLSQSVFAKLLNVSPSSVRQWEQGARVPTGATKILLEVLDKSPSILDYRLSVVK